MVGSPDMDNEADEHERTNTSWYNNKFGAMTTSPFPMVKGDYFTGFTLAGIIRCLEVQHHQTAYP
jgi:hypothetical protein